MGEDLPQQYFKLKLLHNQLIQIISPTEANIKDVEKITLQAIQLIEDLAVQEASDKTQIESSEALPILKRSVEKMKLYLNGEPVATTTLLQEPREALSRFLYTEF